MKPFAKCCVDIVSKLMDHVADYHFCDIILISRQGAEPVEQESGSKPTQRQAFVGAG